MTTLHSTVPVTVKHYFIWSKLILMTMLMTMIVLAGCGGSADDVGNDAGSGELFIGVTDAPGGFSTYTVDVLSLTLTTASGAVVETLPINTRVDFARYTDLTEFLTAATVPAARYVKATLRLDYRNAEIWVRDSSINESVKIEQFVDADGNPIATLDVSVHLQNRNSLVIVRGVPAYLSLDFNLQASNELLDNATVPTLAVQPFLIADLQPERPKLHRVRGPLFDVDVDNNQFQIAIHPFMHRLALRDQRFGQLSVNVNDTTIYDIDGQRYQGSAGLDVLASMPAFTATIVKGDFNIRSHRFAAKAVYAGSSVPGGGMDVVLGNVTRRDANMLTVQGATLIRNDGSVVFNDSISVDVSADTVVRKALSMGDNSIADISIGQKVSVFGTLRPVTPGSALVLDATTTENRVFMGLTVLRGIASLTGGPLVMDLQTIDYRPIGFFDFTGSGIDPDNDADPAQYELDTGTLDTGAIASGSPIAVGGFATPFGQAPLDFTAQTVVDLSALAGVMVVNWNPPATNPFESLAGDGMILNLADVGPFHHVGRAGVAVDLLGVGLPPTIVPVHDETGLYIIQRAIGPITLYSDFTLYREALQGLLDSGEKVRNVTAQGHYDDVTATMVAEKIITRTE